MIELALTIKWRQFPAGTTFLTYPVNLEREKIVAVFKGHLSYRIPRSILKPVDDVAKKNL